MKNEELISENAALKAGNLEIVKENQRIRENAEALRLYAESSKKDLSLLKAKINYWRERSDLAENRVFRREMQIRELLSEFGELERMGSILGIDNFSESDLL